MRRLHRHRHRAAAEESAASSTSATYELRGPADQIEQNTKRYIEEHTGRTFAGDEWTKIALTEKQVNASVRLQRLAITKLDKRYKPAKEYEAIECEALGQGVLVRLIRKHLDRLLPEPLDVEREDRALQIFGAIMTAAPQARRRNDGRHNTRGDTRRHRQQNIKQHNDSAQAL